VIALRVHPSIRGIAEQAWDGLLGADGPPFLRWAFLDALEETGCVGGDTGWLPHHLAFEEDGELVAVAPAYLKDNSEGEFVFDFQWAGLAHRLGVPYYPKLVVAVPFTPATGARLLVRDEAERPRLLAALAEALRVVVAEHPLSSAHVLFPTEPEAHALAGAGLVPRYGIQFHWHNAGYSSFDDFLARFDAKRRHQIRREMREMDKLGITIETLSGRDLDGAMIDVMFELYLATIAKFSWGRQYLCRAFFETLVARMPDAVEMVVAREGSEIIAGALNYRSATTLYGRYWGARVERPFLHFNVCYYHSIERCIRLGIRTFEPGAGGEHKLVRGFAPTLTWSAHHLADRRLDKILRPHLAREREAVLEAVRRETSR
jgi:predicted N-acyltransferase